VRAILLVATALALTPLAHAQPGDPNNASTSGFKQLDKDGNGTISPAEAAADKEIAKRFKAFDANKDGKLQEEEYLQAGNDNSKRVLADTAITTKIKGELLLAKGLPSTAISVETYEGQVQLSGFVDKKEQVAAAGKVAASVSGVKKVHNGLRVK
jgi:hyperosmotically inducible protein